MMAASFPNTSYASLGPVMEAPSLANFKFANQGSVNIDLARVVKMNTPSPNRAYGLSPPAACATHGQGAFLAPKAPGGPSEPEIATGAVLCWARATMRHDEYGFT